VGDGNSNLELIDHNGRHLLWMAQAKLWGASSLLGTISAKSRDIHTSSVLHTEHLMQLSGSQPKRFNFNESQAETDGILRFHWIVNSSWRRFLHWGLLQIPYDFEKDHYLPPQFIWNTLHLFQCFTRHF